MPLSHLPSPRHTPKQGMIPGRVWVMCSSVDTKMALCLGQRLAPDAPFCARAFDSKAGGFHGAVAGAIAADGPPSCSIASPPKPYRYPVLCPPQAGARQSRRRRAWWRWRTP